MSIKAAQTSDQNSKDDRTEDHQEEWDVRDFEELMIRKRGKAEPDDHRLCVLHKEKDADDQDNKQSNIFDPSHLYPPFGIFPFREKSIKAS